MKYLGHFKNYLNNNQETYSFYAESPFEAETRSQEIAKSFGWTVLFYEQIG